MSSTVTWLTSFRTSHSVHGVGRCHWWGWTARTFSSNTSQAAT